MRKIIGGGHPALHIDSLGGRTGVRVIRVILNGTRAVVRAHGIEYTVPVSELTTL